MDMQLKQRLIGAIVIFSLLIIFLPMFIDSDNSDEKLEQMLVPSVAEKSEHNLVFNSKEIADFVQDNEVLLPNTGAVARNTADTVSVPDSAKPSILSDTASDTASDAGAKKAAIKIDPTTTSNKEIAKKLQAAEEQAYQNAAAAFTASESKQQIDKSDESNQPKEQVTKIKPAQAIKYNIPESLAKSDIYAIKIAQAKNTAGAAKIKNLLLSMGFPAYTSKAENDFAVYVGPDMELKYIKELATRIIDETDYQPEIISQNKTGL